MVIPLCATCRHYNDDPVAELPCCAAFPHRIPPEILLSEADHRKPYENDHGVQYEQGEQGELEVPDAADEEESFDLKSLADALGLGPREDWNEEDYIRIPAGQPGAGQFSGSAHAIWAQEHGTLKEKVAALEEKAKEKTTPAQKAQLTKMKAKLAAHEAAKPPPDVWETAEPHHAEQDPHPVVTSAELAEKFKQREQVIADLRAKSKASWALTEKIAKAAPAEKEALQTQKAKLEQEVDALAQKATELNHLVGHVKSPRELDLEAKIAEDREMLASASTPEERAFWEKGIALKTEALLIVRADPVAAAQKDPFVKEEQLKLAQLYRVATDPNEPEKTRAFAIAKIPEAQAGVAEAMKRYNVEPQFSALPSPRLTAKEIGEQHEPFKAEKIHLLHEQTTIEQVPSGYKILAINPETGKPYSFLESGSGVVDPSLKFGSASTAEASTAATSTTPTAKPSKKSTSGAALPEPKQWAAELAAKKLGGSAVVVPAAGAAPSLAKPQGKVSWKAGPGPHEPTPYEKAAEGGNYTEGELGLMKQQEAQDAYHFAKVKSVGKKLTPVQEAVLAKYQDTFTSGQKAHLSKTASGAVPVVVAAGPGEAEEEIALTPGKKANLTKKLKAEAAAKGISVEELKAQKASAAVKQLVGAEKYAKLQAHQLALEHAPVSRSGWPEWIGGAVSSGSYHTKMKDSAVEWRGALPSEQGSALSAYQDGAYGDYNGGSYHGGGLRKGTLNAGTEGPIRALTNALETAPETSKDMYVWRGFSLTPLAQDPIGFLAKTGNVFYDNGFVSTSVNPSTALDFAGGLESGVLMRIKLPKGTKTPYLNRHSYKNESYEWEHLLQRGAAFLVSHVWKTSNGYTVMDVEYLGSKPEGLTAFGAKHDAADDTGEEILVLTENEDERYLWTAGDLAAGGVFFFKLAA